MNLFNNSDSSIITNSILLGDIGSCICGILTGYLIYLILCVTKFSSEKTSIRGIALISGALVSCIGMFLVNLVTLLGYYIRP